MLLLERQKYTRYRVTGKYIFLPLQKLHLVAKMNLHFHSDQRVKIIKCAGNMLMFNVDVNIGMRFKKTSRFYDLRDNHFIHDALSDLKLSLFPFHCTALKLIYVYSALYNRL